MIRIWPIAGILSLCLGIWCGSAHAVDPSRFSVPVEAEAPSATVFLERLERVEQELARLGEPAVLPSPRPAVLPFIDDVRLYSTNVYDVTGVRYLSLRVFFLNQSDAPKSLDTTRVTLVVDGHAQTIRDIPEQQRAQVIDVAGQPLTISEVLPPATVALPAGKTTAVQFVFLPINSRLSAPAMVLRYEVGGTAVDLDLNRFHRGKLNLKMTRLGPGGACAVATIDGTLDAVNAIDLAERLDSAARQGVRRAVVAWPADSPPVPPRLMGWLGYTGHSDSPLYAQLPLLSSDIHTLHLVLPKGNTPDNTEEGYTASVQPDVETAVSAALAGVYAHQSRETVLRELQSGNPLARGATVKHGGKRLLPADLPLLATFLNDPSLEVQRSAAQALADFDSPLARQVLSERARTGPAAGAEAAFEALAASRFASNAAVAGQIVEQVTNIPEPRLIKILGRSPQSGFRDKVVLTAQAGESEARVIALSVMSAFRDVPVASLLANALMAQEQPVRDAAFSLLAVSLNEGDAELRRLAIDEAARRLKINPSDTLARSIAVQTRDTRLRGILLERLSDSTIDRREWIDLVGQGGGNEVVSALEDNFSDFNPWERATALRHLWTLQSSRAVEFAAEEVRANHTETIDQAVNILSNDGSDSSVAVLAEAVARADENEGYRFAEALSTIASPAAYDALLDLRDSGRKKSHVYAMWGFSHLWSRSPAAEPAEGAQRILEITSPGSSVPASESDPLRGAFELLDAAQSMDPLLPQIYSHRGSAWQRKENWEEAAREYRAALTLNPDDHVALTGFAITMVMQSRESEAFEWVKAAAPFFKDNNIYLYNSACVYGRALERAQAAAPSPERDAHIEEYRKQALGFLSQSLERGFEQPELMKADPDLKALRGDPQFEKLSGRASGTDPAP